MKRGQRTYANADQETSFWGDYVDASISELVPSIQQSTPITEPGEVRLYIINQDNAHASDNNTFWNAAKNVQKSHAYYYGGWNGIQNRKKVYSGLEVVQYINEQKKNSIQSLDIFSHGGSHGMWFSHTKGGTVTDKEIFGTKFQLDTKYHNLFMNEEMYETNDGYDDGIDDNGVKDINEIKENYPQLTRSAVLADIKMINFKIDARVEFQGCANSGGDGHDKSPTDNMCATFSTQLYAAGKTKAVVIGHYGESGPDADPKKPVAGAEDYRRGKRMMWWNGNLILQTTYVGHLSQATIDAAIDNFKKNHTVTNLAP